jgi:hypothetical protein
MEMAMRRIFLILPLIAVAGCATGPSLQSRMAAYTGASGETLVQDLGVPDKQISLHGVQYLAYVRQRAVVDPGPPVFIGFSRFGGPFGGPFGGGLYDGGLNSSVTVWRCDTTFMLHDDKVVSFTLRGNDCS